MSFKELNEKLNHSFFISIMQESNFSLNLNGIKCWNQKSGFMLQHRFDFKFHFIKLLTVFFSNSKFLVSIYFFLLQVFNSIGIAFGCLVAFSSYNPFHGPILKDTLIVVVVDAFTCIICGLCVFSTMGNLALEQGTVNNF